MNNLVLYKHVNPLTKEVFYVGQGAPSRPYTKSPKDRSKEWFAYVEKNGYEIVIIAMNLSKESAIEMENALIDSYGRVDLGTGLLLNKTGGTTGWSPETRSKMSKITSERLILRNKNFTEEEKKVRSERMRHIASNLTSEQLTKRRKSQMKPVLQLDLDNNPIRYWYGAQDAASTLGFTRQQISGACNGYFETYMEYKWKFVSKEEFQLNVDPSHTY